MIKFLFEYSLNILRKNKKAENHLLKIKGSGPESFIISDKALRGWFLFGLVLSDSSDLRKRVPVWTHLSN